MIIGRFKVQCQPDRADEVAAAIAAVEGPSREIPGVVHFDAARSLTDPNSFVVTEVFEDRRALERQNAQSEVATVLSLIEAGALTGDLEWTVWETSRDSG
jgi:quinol monooxygenase YgiN